MNPTVLAAAALLAFDEALHNNPKPTTPERLLAMKAALDAYEAALKVEPSASGVTENIVLGVDHNSGARSVKVIGPRLFVDSFTLLAGSYKLHLPQGGRVEFHAVGGRAVVRRAP